MSCAVGEVHTCMCTVSNDGESFCVKNSEHRPTRSETEPSLSLESKLNSSGRLYTTWQGVCGSRLFTECELVGTMVGTMVCLQALNAWGLPYHACHKGC